MHIPENYLSPQTCIAMTAVMVPVWKHAVTKIKEELPKEKMPMLGVGASFSFLAMMINVPLVGGTTGHAVGGTLIALMFGPNAACIVVSIALLIQALIFGDGGVLSFGANCFNMAFILPYIGYYVYRMVMKSAKQYAVHKQRMIHGAAAAIGSYIGINAAAFFTALEFGIQPLLFKDSLGSALYCPYDITVSVPAMMIPHLLVAGVVEALFTTAVFLFVLKTDEDLVYVKINKGNRQNQRKKHIPVYVLLLMLICITPVGLLADGTAWGEWGADEILNLNQGGIKLASIPKGMKNGWSFHAILPDYAYQGANEVLVYVFCAILGVTLLVLIFKCVIFFRRKNKAYDS